MSVARQILLPLVLGWLGRSSSFGAPVPPTLVSDVPGFLFIEGEPARVALERVGPGREEVFQFELKDTETAWNFHGEGKLPKLPADEKQRVVFDLPFPERGLYRLHVSGKSGQAFSLEKTVALTFAPRPVDPQSPWGIFYVPPVWFAPNDSAGPERAAASLRRLGASWVRLNFWASAMEPVVVSPGPSGPIVTPELKRWKGYATALRSEGLQILGEIAQTPRALSSEPANLQTAGDGGPAYNRSKPADYAAWEQLMEKVAQEFREEIEVWEVWNEPDNQGVYWRGSPDELVELVRHTAAGLRRGNPKARIAGCGFTSSPAGRFFADATLRAGLAKELDVFTFHYSDIHPGDVERWRELLAPYHRDLPLWNTEARLAVPYLDREQGVERSFKFLHVAIGYEESEPLVGKDYAVRPAGLAFAVGARLLGNAKYVRTETVAGGSLHLFSENGSAIGMYQAEPLARFLAGPGPLRAVVLAHPPHEQALLVTNLRGKTREERPPLNAAHLDLTTSESTLLLHGWPTLEPEAVAPESLGRFEAEKGHFGPHWRRVAAWNASGQAVLETDPEKAGSPAEVEIDFSVPEEGEYDLLLAIQNVPASGTPDTPCGWSVDRASSQISSRLPGIVNGGEAAGVRSLGTVHLEKGRHTFRWTSGWPNIGGWAGPQLDALALRRASPGLGSLPTKKG